VRLIGARLDRGKCRLPLVSGIGAEMLRIVFVRPGTRNHDSGQCRLQQFDIMHVGAAGDER
jgi:hypothetical protein